LRALAAIKDRRRWRLKLTVGHVQHHLRGDEAERDAGFVEALARQLKLPQPRVDLDLSGVAGNVEDAARRARYGALVEMAQESGAGFIATAHHGDDQLETLLMRMLRGAGIGGMRGIAWRRELGIGEDDAPPSLRNPNPDTRYPTLIRPMLAVSRSQVIDYLNTIGQPWREDKTNADRSRWRARLRAEVLPVLEAIRPGAGRKATVFADHLRDVHRVLDDAVDAVLKTIDRKGGRVTLSREAGKRLRQVVLSGLVRRVLSDAGVPGDKLGAEQLDRVVRAVMDKEGGERVFTFGGGVRLTVTRDQISIG
jgi:tRNA(Ile)-lysidine synthase